MFPSLLKVSGPALLGQIVAFLLVPLIAAGLGPQGFGTAAVVQSVFAFILPAVTFKLDVFAQRGGISNLAWVVRSLGGHSLISVVVFGVSANAALVLLGIGLEFASIAMVFLVVASLFLFQISSAFAVRKGRLGLFGASRLAQSLGLNGFLVLAFWVSVDAAPLAIFAILAANLIGLIFTAGGAMRLATRLKYDVVRSSRWILQHLSLAFGGLASGAMQNSLIWFATLFFTTRDVGSIALASRLFLAGTTLIAYPMSLVVSSKVKEFAFDHQRLSAFLRRVLLATFVLTATLVALLFLAFGIGESHLPQDWAGLREVSAPIIVLAGLQMLCVPFSQLPYLIGKRAVAAGRWEWARVLFLLAAMGGVKLSNFGIQEFLWTYVSLQAVMYAVLSAIAWKGFEDARASG